MIHHPKSHQFILNHVKQQGGTYSEGFLNIGHHESERTYFLITKPQHPKGQVFLIHGAGDHATYPSFKLITQLFQNNYQTFSFDLPGHGPNSTTIFSPTSLIDTISSAFEMCLVHSTHLRPLHIVGFSLGGILALEVLKANSYFKVQSIVMIGSPMKLTLSYRLLLPEIRYSLNKDFLKIIHDLGFWGSLPAIGAFKRKDFPIRINSSHLNYMEIVADFINSRSLSRESPSIKLPALAVYGKNDQIAPPFHGKMLIRKFLPNQISLIDGCNHFMLNFNEASIRCIVDWLNRKNQRDDQAS